MRLFISYAHVDRFYIERIVKVLQAAGHIPWYDGGLLPGPKWKTELYKQIELCDEFIYAYSQESLASEWCRWELNQACELQKRFMGILLRDNALIPSHLSEYQFADFTKPDSDLFVAKLLSGLHVAPSLSPNDKLLVSDTPSGIPAQFEQVSLESSPTSEMEVDEEDTTWIDIVNSQNRLLQVVAGPGTGKTFSMLRRVHRLLVDGNDPKRILLLTFSRAGVNDLQRGLGDLKVVGASVLQEGAKTLHSFCFSLLQSEQVWMLSRQVRRTLLEFEKRFMLQDLKSDKLGNITTLQERLKGFEAAWAREPDNEPGWAEDELDKAFYIEMVNWLVFHQGILIEELIPQSLDYLRNNPGCQPLRQYDFVLVDEYQDLNRADQRLLDLLSKRGSLMVIGDEDQAIYEQLRYSHPEGIFKFAETHKEADLGSYRLNLCRRCPTRIVSMANSLIEPNKHREKRQLTPRASNVRGEIVVIQWSGINSEAEGIARYIDTKVSRGEFEPKDILILCPRRAFGPKILRALLEYNRPAKILFRQKIFESGNYTKAENHSEPKVKAQERFTLLRLIADPNDPISLRCWLGFWSNNLRSRQYRTLWDKSQENTLISFYDKSPRGLLDSIIAGESNISGIEQLVERYKLLKTYQNQFVGREGRDVFDNLFPIHEEWAAEIRSIAEENVKEWTLNKIIEGIEKGVADPIVSAETNAIRIMTLHQSKGLEAKHVIIIGCNDGLIPSNPRATDLIVDKNRFAEEQRRLFYVAITRAKETLVLSHAQQLPYTLALQIGARIKRQVGDEAEVFPSSFISKSVLGPECPDAIFEDEWIY